MKFTRPLVFLVALAPVIAFASVCDDIASSYNTRIMTLQTEANAAMSSTSDPAEIQAIKMMFDMQKAQLEAERDSVLASNNCFEEPPMPTPEPSDSPTPDPSPSPTATPPIDDNGGGDDDDDDNGGGNGNMGCAEAYQQARLMAAEGRSVREVHHFLHAAGCNAGQWQAGKDPKQLGNCKPKSHGKRR